ncbi:MAG: putative DNA binding CopG/RHH family protein [Saprospiraceae bacterium]|jgi:predicted DNA binding CopG/RHH family protein
MINKPIVKSYVEDEGEKLIDAIESDNYLLGKSGLSDKILSELRESALNTINDERQKITIRVPQTDLARLKAKALREGIPYQATINALIHKYATC